MENALNPLASQFFDLLKTSFFNVSKLLKPSITYIHLAPNLVLFYSLLSVNGHAEFEVIVKN